MLEFLGWFFDLLSPISGLVIFAAIVVGLLAVSFFVSLIVAKIES